MNPKVLRITHIFLFTSAIILFALASVSSPIIKSLGMLQTETDALSIDGSLTIGLWGACYKVGDRERCTSTSIGYDLSTLDKVPGAAKIQESLSSLTAAGVLLHPFAVAALLVALLLSFSSKPVIQHAALWAAFLSLFLCTFALCLDLFLYIPTMKVIQAVSPFNVYMGPAFFLVVIGLALASVGTFVQSKLRRAIIGKK